jgi:hypothetical protein
MSYHKFIGKNPAIFENNLNSDTNDFEILDCLPGALELRAN